MTGVTVFSVALELKRLELVRELISPTPLIALLINPNNLTATTARRELNEATRRIGQDVVMLEASTEGEFEAAFATLAQKRANAVVVSDDALFANRRSALVALAARHAIPAIYGRREFPEAGGLMSYGAASSIRTSSPASMSAVFSRARSQPICRSCSRPNSNRDQPQDRKDARPRGASAADSPRRRSHR